MKYPRFAAFSLFPLFLTTLTHARPLLTPLEQDRHVTTVLSALSQGVGTSYELTSEAEEFQPFGAGISGTLSIETSLSMGVVGQRSELDDDLFSVSATTYAYAKAAEQTDEAATHSSSVFMVTFEVTTPIHYMLDGLADASGSRKSAAAVRLTRENGDILFEFAAGAKTHDFFNEGVLDPGVYTLAARAESFAEPMPRSDDRGSADFRLTFQAAVVAPACACDWNGDGMLDSNDLFAFVTDFMQSDADFDGSGETTSADLFAFMRCFATGCI